LKKKKKKRLMSRLLHIQKVLAIRPSQSLHLSQELNHILNLEEDLWAIKARTSWVVMGERNISYFHLSTLARRSANKMSGFKDAASNWSFDIKRIRSSFLEGYKELYQTDQISCDWCPNPLPCSGAVLSLEESDSIVGPATDIEIFNALYSMKLFKAPGPDGLHAGFLQQFWMVVGASVKNEVKFIFLFFLLLFF
jgi:hypothetical protein